MAFKEKLSAYYWLTKPGIIYGNLITTAAGFLLAARGNIDWVLFVASLVGTTAVIASACVFNNYTDKDIDSRMAMTKKRALVSGYIGGKSALIYASALGIIGFLVLAILVNALVALIAAAAFVFYVIFYGVAKRHSVHGALVGSVPGAAPPVIGYCAVTDHLDGGALILFLILVFWQMPHFYAIAMYRFKDYKAAKLPVMTVRAGVRATKLQIQAYILAFIVAAAALTVFDYTGRIYLLIVLAAGLYWFWLGLKDFAAADNEAWGRKMFLFSLVVNLTFALTISFDWLLVKI